MGLLSAHPIIATIVGITTAVVALGTAIDHFHVTSQESADALSNMRSSYSDNKSELESLNSELATTQSRMNELQAKGHLTLTEKEELSNLQAQNAELERTIALKEAQQKIEAKKTASQAEETYKKWTTVSDFFGKEIGKASYSKQAVQSFEDQFSAYGSIDKINAIKNDAIKKWWQGNSSVSMPLESIDLKGNADNINYLIGVYESLQTAQKNVAKELDAIAQKGNSATEDELKQAESLQEYYDSLGQKSVDAQSYMNDYVDTISEVYDAYKEAESQGVISDKQKTQLKEIESFMSDYMQIVTNTARQTETAINNLFAKSQFINLKDELIEAGKSSEKVLQGVIKKTPGLTDALDTAGISAQQLSDYIMALADPDSLRLDEVKKQLEDSFVPDTRTIGAHAKKAKQEVFDTFMSDKSDTEIEIFYKYVNANDLDMSDWTADDLVANYKKAIDEAQNAIDSTEPITFSSLFASDEEGSLNKTVDNFQSNINSIDSALTNLKNGEKVDLTDLTQQFPELAGQTDNLEESLNNLKATKLSEFASKWRTFTADLDPSQMELANSFMKSLIENIDLSETDITDTKTKLISALIPNPTDLDPAQRQGIIDNVNEWVDNAKPKFTTLKDIFDVDQTSSTIDKYKSQITSLRDSLDTLKSGSMDKTAITDLIEQFPELANETDDLQSGIEDLIDSLNADTGSFFDDLIEKMKLNGAEQSAIEAAEKYKKALMDSLNDIDESIWASPLMDAIDQAGQTKNAGSDYENAVSNLKTAKELFDDGLTGTDDFKSIAKYISPTGATDPMNFAENYAKAKRYLTDGDKGVKNFLNDLSTKTDDAGNALASFNDKTKEWTYNIKDAESAAQSMGIGFEFFMDMFGRLEDYGAHNNFFSSVAEGEQHISDVTNKLTQAQRELAQLEAQGANSSAIEAKKAEVDSYISDLKSSNQLMDDVVASSVERESKQMQNAIDTIESLTKTRDEALQGNAYGDYTDKYVEDLNRQIQDIAKESGIELDANLNVTEESKEKAKAEIKKLYGDGTIENPLKRDFGNGRDVLDTIQKYDSITKKIQEQTAAGNEELAKSFETLKNYSQSQLSGIDLFDGKYDSSELQDAEKALDNIMTTLGVSKDEASQLINVLADMGLIKLDIDTSSLETSDINSVVENLSEDQTISFKAELEDGSLAEIEAQKDEQGQITYTANVDGVQYAVNSVTQNENGTITYTADINGVETELTSVQNADGTITYTINTQGETPETVPDANGTANFGLGESPDEVPDSQGTANFDLGEYPKTVPDATGTANFNLGTYPTVLPPATQYVNRILMGGDTGKDGDASGTLLSYAHADGTAYNVLNMRSAYADGKVALDHDEQAVVNELGTEGIIRNGRLFAIPGGMHFENLRKGDIILSAQQMKMLFSGRDAGRARAYAEGTAPFSHFIAQSYASGTPAGTGEIAFTGGSSYTGNPLTKAQNDNTKATNDNTTSKQENTEATKESTEAMNWVERGLNKLSKVFERYANQINDYISSTLKISLLKKQLSTIDKQLEANQKGYDAYMAKANSINISSEYKDLVKNGAFKIEDIDTSTEAGKKLAEDIKKFQDYYDSAMDCKDAIIELNNKQLELYDTLANMPTEKAEKKIEKLKRKYESLSAVSDAISSGGSVITALTNQINADNPKLANAQANVAKAETARDKTKATRSTASKVLKAEIADTEKSGASLMGASQKQTSTLARSLKRAAKSSTDKATYNTISKAIRDGKSVSTKGLKGEALKYAKSYNSSLKQQNAISKAIGSGKKVNTSGMSKVLKAEADQYNQDVKAQATAQKAYDKAKEADEKALAKLNKAKATKNEVYSQTTKEQQTLATNKSPKAYVVQNKLLDQELAILKAENTARQTALKEITAETKKQQAEYDKVVASRNKNAKSLLSNKSVTSALNKTQLAALKAGKTVSTKGITDPAVLKKIEAYNKKVSTASDLNKKLNIQLEAQADAVNNAAQAEAEYAQMLVENEKKKLENISNYYDSMMAQFETKNSLIQTYMNRMETRGYTLSTSFYEAQIANQKQIANKQKAELAAMQKSFQEAIENGIEPGTQEYNEMKDTIDQLTLSIAETTNNIVELQASIRDLEWEQFDRLQESIKRVASESDFLIELMSSKELYDKKTGLLTDEGWATMGLHGVNYNTYMAQADKYKEEMLKISAELANDPNNQKLIDRKNELIDAQQQSILAAENEKKSIRDMVENGIDIELDAIDDLIDKYLEALEAKRSLWEYEKKIQKQAESIASLQKQLAAYQNDNSEEARAKIQEIKVNLKDAQDDLKEAEYDKFISDQKELLESLRNDYEEVLNKRLDNIDVLIQTSIDQINANAENIQATLTEQATSVGYELSTEMQTIWASTDGVAGAIATYDGNFSTTMTGVSTALGNIYERQRNMIEAINNMAEKYIQKVDEITKSPVISSLEEGSEKVKVDESDNKNTASLGGVTTGKTNLNDLKNTGSSGGATLSGGSSSSSSGSSNKNNASNDNSNIWKGIAKDNSMKGNKSLDINTSIYDRIAYNGYKTGFASQKQLYSNLKGSGTYTGTAEQNTWMINQLKLKGYASGGHVDKDQWAFMNERGQELIEYKGATLVPLPKSANIWNAPKTKALLDEYSRYQSFQSDYTDKLLKSLQSVSVGNGNSESIQANCEITFNLPNVKSYPEFMNQMVHDPKFEKLINAITIDKVHGGSSHGKYKVTWKE